MSEHEVKYTLSLRDLLSGKLIGADGHAKKLEGTLGHVHNLAMNVFEGIGIGFAAIKIGEFVNESREKFHALHLSEVQLENTLANVGERAGITGEQMVEMAERMSQSIPYTQAQIVDMEGAISRFGNIGKENFEKITIASADISAALHRDGAEVARSLGRIMEAPAQNARLLRQFGVSLTTDQQKLVKQLQATGHVAQAQELIFRKLAEKGYEGAAKAAANTDPLFRYHKIMERIQLKIGEVAMKFQQHLAPVLERVANAFMGLIHWIERNEQLLKTIGKVILYAAYVWGLVRIAALAYRAVLIITYMWQMRYVIAESLMNTIKVTAAITTGTLTGAMTALNIAMRANPIGFVIGLIIILGGAIYGAYKKFGKFHAAMYGLWYGLKAFAKFIWEGPMKIFAELGFAVANIFHPAKMMEHLKAAKDVVFNGAKDIASEFGKGYKIGMDDFNASQAADAKTNSPKSLIKKGDLGDSGLDGKAGATEKATGNKSTVVNVTIKDGLIKEFNLNTTNLKEGSGKIKEIITQVLLGAVNQSQLIAGE